MTQVVEQRMEMLALEYFRRGYNCAESVILAANGVFDPEDAFLSPCLGSGFGGGMGDGQGPCGALSGGVVVIGAFLGRHSRAAGDSAARGAARDLAAAFENDLGATRCKDLLLRHRTAVLFRKCGWITGRGAVLLARVLLAHDVTPLNPSGPFFEAGVIRPKEAPGTTGI